jgi:hypothetical protein
MTISNQTCSVTYTGNGSQTVFTYNFLIPYQSDGVTPAVEVYLITDGSAELIDPADYTIAGVDDPDGGTVTYSPAITSAYDIRIDRALEYTQPDEYLNQGFYPESVEDTADKLEMQIQQLAAQIARIIPTLEQNPLESWGFALSDETTAIQTGTSVVTFFTQYPFEVESITGSLSDASSSGAVVFDVNADGVTMLSTKVTVDANEEDSRDATTQPVLAITTLASGTKITFDIDSAGTGAAGAKVYINGRQPWVP